MLVSRAGSARRSVEHLAEPPPFPRRRHRRLDELRLPAVAMRRHHQPARHAVGRRRSPVAANEMQAEVDAGRGARRRQQAALVDVQHVGHHADARIGLGQPLAVAPVRGRPLAVEQTRRRQHEHARAERQQPAPPLACARRSARTSGAGTGVVRAPPARHDDGAGPFQQGQPAVDADADAAHGAHRAPHRRRPRGSGTSCRPSPGGRARRSRPPRRIRTCTARRRPAQPPGGCPADWGVGRALARSLRSLASAPLVAYPAFGVKCRRPHGHAPSRIRTEENRPWPATSVPLPRQPPPRPPRTSPTSCRSRPIAGTCTSRSRTARSISSCSTCAAPRRSRAAHVPGASTCRTPTSPPSA